MNEAWQAENYRWLSAEVARVRARLETGSAGGSRSEQGATPWPDALDRPPALLRLADALGLSSFEREVLLFCAAAELDPSIPALCATAGDPHRPHPTFSLVLALLPEAHWDALSPARPLRYWRLLELIGDGPLVTRTLRIDERVLHHLLGIDYLDERLSGRVQRSPLAASPGSPSHEALARRIVSDWHERADVGTPGIQLCGGSLTDLVAIAAIVAELAGGQLHLLRAEAAPDDPGEREALARLLDREAVFWPMMLHLACGEERSPAAVALADALSGPIIVTSREPIHTTRRLDRYAFHRPRWRPSTTGSHGSTESGRASSHGDETLSGLAQQLKPLARWDDLVLPKEQIALLHEVAAQVRHMETVYETWGFARLSNRGLGISSLFSGQSGTGKTMAAEVLANELSRDLYRVDLSAVISKYIGETEKNLGRVFDAAEDAGAILLFDEADALFGRRSEVKDSHDRYANIEVSYLLQRMEQYDGLAILTTNFRSALDPAFLRRIRFIVNFPFPDATLRAEIWRRVFPHEMPRDGVDFAGLARLSVTGGGIRNIAVNAAFLAAEAEEPVAMTHLLRAARTEYAKTEKPMSEVEMAGRP